MSTPPSPAKIGRNGKEEKSTATSEGKDEVLFRVKRDAKLRRHMDMYSARQSIHLQEVRFVEPGAGRIIREEQIDAG
ncbi:unnamed protein product [Urochloa humidicola]